MVKLGALNSRMNDFYDTSGFSPGSSTSRGRVLAEAISATFATRHTPLAFP